MLSSYGVALTDFYIGLGPFWRKVGLFWTRAVLDWGCFDWQPVNTNQTRQKVSEGTLRKRAVAKPQTLVNFLSRFSDFLSPLAGVNKLTSFPVSSFPCWIVHRPCCLASLHSQPANVLLSAPMMTRVYCKIREFNQFSARIGHMSKHYGSCFVLTF